MSDTQMAYQACRIIRDLARKNGDVGANETKLTLAVFDKYSKQAARTARIEAAA